MKPIFFACLFFSAIFTSCMDYGDVEPYDAFHKEKRRVNTTIEEEFRQKYDLYVVGTSISNFKGVFQGIGLRFVRQKKTSVELARKIIVEITERYKELVNNSEIFKETMDPKVFSDAQFDNAIFFGAANVRRDSVPYLTSVGAWKGKVSYLFDKMGPKQKTADPEDDEEVIETYEEAKAKVLAEQSK